MYTISHIVSYIHCNSCNLSNNTHPHRNTLCYNELQMVIVTQKPSCKASCKSPHFLIVLFLLSVIPPPIFEPFPYKVNIMSRLVLLTTSCTTPSFVSLNESTNSAKLGLGNGDFLYLIGTQFATLCIGNFAPTSLFFSLGPCYLMHVHHYLDPTQ